MVAVAMHAPTHAKIIVCFQSVNIFKDRIVSLFKWMNILL